jgi:FAD/FMN-containing dehydrogenase
MERCGRDASCELHRFCGPKLAKCQLEAMDADLGRKGIVVYVESTEEISTVVKLTQEYAVSFSVCGGKHSSSGASSSTGGLVVDLGKMRNVEINTATKTVKAQGGCIWKDVDEAAAEHGLAMVGGTVNHTGVGGL